MEATKSSDEVGHSEQIISFKDDEKHLPSEMTQRGQSSGLENKIRLAERSKAPIVSPSPFLESQVFASVKTFTSKSRDQHNIHLRKKSIPLPNKRYLQSEYKLLSGGLQKKDKKSIKAGKYVCQYCGRACAKPSVLKKHIRSHTGERPYPCIPCGFSFKTMSNLYKHRKSHTHAVKAGLVSCSKSKSRHVNDEAEGEMHSDVERTSDTDEEALDILASDSKNATERTGFVVKKEDRFSAQSSGKKKIGPSGKVSLWQFREMMAPDTIAQVDQMIEFSSVKHKLALRLSEKKSQESDQSLSLPSSYSKGSTDSGYFSRSESAEQQFGQSSSSAKSYQEIMFGKCYRPAARPKQSITVQTCMIDINEATSSFMVKPNKGLVAGETESIYKSKKNLVQATKMDSESFLEEDFQECQNPSSDPLETTSDGGVFLRSNSLPTSSNPSVNEPQVLRMSNSFDERIAATDVSYRSAMGMKRLMRQSAFEHCANEGHGESDCYIHLACSLKSELKIQSIDKSEICAENSNETESSFVSSNQSSEILTRKRRKGNTVEEGPGLTQDISSNISGTSEEHKIKENISDERRSGSNVISVIQHTNSVSRLTSAEKSCDGTSVEKEHSMQETGPDWQWGPGSFLQQKLHMQKQLVAQSSIQVPEIRVTVEPDMPEKSLDPIVKQREKHSEEFQWPQRSETLSQFPVEKLPPKKKRLRLAEMECSSGESSFESACTSLSRSPSQDSNLSHSSSFSQSLDREETLHLASQSLPDESNRPLEFLSVPGRSQNHHREMRRCASEQAPHKLPSEIPEFRSKSFDYGSLYFSTSKLEDIKERRKAFLVRQESLSGEPEMLVGLVSDEMSKRTTSPNKLFMIEGSMKYSSAGPSTHLKLQYVQPSFCNVKEMDNIMLGIKNEPEEVKTSEPHIHLRKHQEEWSQSLGNVLSTISMLSQSQQAFASQTSTGFLVPVRIQMQVPNYGNTTYTSISHILDSHRQKPLPCIELKKSSSQNLPVILPQTNLRCDPIISGQPIQILCSTQASPAKLNTGIPLSLTSKTISTTEAPSGGANKRMLSPASSIEFFIEAKQQKRIKDENIYGQIVEELGAVELENLKHDKEFPEKSFRSESTPKTCDPSDEHMDEPMQDIYTNSELQMLEQKPTPEDLIVAQHSSSSVGMVPSALPGAILFSKFPGLHTTTCVSWCYLNSIKPSSSLAAAPFSEYASWFVRCHNPNPPDQSTGKVLGLLRSKQQSQNAVYSVATMYQPGLLVTSMPWRLKQEQTTLDHRTEALKQDVKQKDSSQEEKPFIEDVATTLCQAEPVRVKIFEGGYKSNEDYIYVRGRGRGKYICEECGIRCKKPSMLKKHIRTHTDVRPYICKCCNFAFKTKGNLTKHMKSKAHMKKCLELGVSPLATDNTEDGDDIQMLGNVPVETTSKHQFSDAEDSDGVDEDEPDDDEEDDECDGDSTPRTLSRSTSPQSYAVTKPYRSSSHSKDSLNQQLEVSSIGSEDDLNFDQSSSSFEVYPPQLLSPCWDSPCQRYMSPSGDVSPCQQFSSRDSSPLRAISPRRDLSIRGDFSPVRQLSPARPKGSDTSGQRTQSPLGRQKVVLRAMSPRRGSYQQRTHMDPGRSVRFQASPIRPIIREHKVDGDNPSNLCIPTGLCNRKDLPKTLQLDMFSHLPLHSQGKIPTPVPMVPIGGLRMPAISTYSVAAVGNSSLSVTEENISSPVLNPEFVCSGKTAANFTEFPGKDVKKEENIYICAKAIASLRITSEDATHKPPNC